MRGASVAVNGTALTCDDLVAIARDHTRVSVEPSGRDRAADAWRTAREVTARKPVYGRTTGVGANGIVPLDTGGDDLHGVRLLRSHAAGAGPLLGPEPVRAMLAVRLNQIAAGGSGVHPGVLDALGEALNRNALPPVHRYGAIGTGDLSALASAALCLRGERDWCGGLQGPRFQLGSADALAFISSNAVTLGESALAVSDLSSLAGASITVAALSLVATRGSPEAFAQAVHEARPHPGQQEAAAAMRLLLTPSRHSPARLQDPFGYRAFPQVHGPVVDAARHAEAVVIREINAAAENPLVDVRQRTVWHNGNFLTADVGLALDAVRAALFQTAALSAARLGTLVDPAFTGLLPFQAAAEAESGIMILEYVAHSAVADIRRFAAPAALGNAVLSRGVEDHAGFSTQSARATTDALAAYRITLACELVAAVRALRMQDRRPASPALRQAFQRADDVLEPETEDRPLGDDIQAASDLLGEAAFTTALPNALRA